jgi:hypothetical protein
LRNIAKPSSKLGNPGDVSSSSHGLAHEAVINATTSLPSSSSVANSQFPYLPVNEFPIQLPSSPIPPDTLTALFAIILGD